MRDIAQGLLGWIDAGYRFAIATVVETWNSAPRQPGAAMAVAENGEVLGSVSGGCVEGAVYETAMEVLTSGLAVSRRYGISSDDAFEVGLSCGGIIDIFVEPGSGAHYPQLPQVLAAVRRGEPVAVATIVSGVEPLGARLIVTPSGVLGDRVLDGRLTDTVRGLLAHGQTMVVRTGPRGEQRQQELGIFVHSFAPPPQMLVFGAIDFAAAVARLGAFLGYRVTVCDARATFATAKRFPHVDQLVVDWPHRFLERTAVDERTVICVLTHDPKFDVPLLRQALSTPARYIGVMGSRRTHEERLQRLREAGVDDDNLARLASPIGLDLGARTPEETAVSIAAEIIALDAGGTGRRLRDTVAAIHH